MKVSVIVPVYNTKEFLQQCVQSVLAQTFKDFELLLIDDGSTDGSDDLSEKLGHLDERIQVYHKTNGGLSDARNYGIKRANGDFLTFIDSDDYIAPSYLKVLCSLVDRYNADVSCLGLQETSARFVEEYDTTNGTGVMNWEKALSCSLMRRYFGISACGKLFRKELFSDIRFPKGELFEDLLTIPYVFEKCQKVAYSSAKLYYYFQRPGSITNSRITEAHLRFFDNTIRINEYFSRYGKEIQDAFEARIIIESINRFAEILLFCPDYGEKIKYIRKKMKPYWNLVKLNPLVPKTIRIQVNILNKSPSLYWLLFTPYKYIKSKKKGKYLGQI